MRFWIASASPDVIALRRELTRSQAGALATFEGWVRDRADGRPVRGLEYDVFLPLAEQEGNRILLEANARFAIVDATCVHRTGWLAVGELAVWVGVSAEHRGAAFDACRYIIDEVKRRVPIWKKECYLDGSVQWIGGSSTAPADP